MHGFAISAGDGAMKGDWLDHARRASRRFSKRNSYCLGRPVPL
jgi:hypothetical protein